MTAVNGEIVISVRAIAANWRALKAQFRGDNVGAVVKANAYGLGLERVVQALKDAGCHTFFVSNLVEAGRVREVSHSAAIVVFSGCAVGEEPEFERLAAQPVIVSTDMLHRWRAHHFTARPRAYLKIDTGMGRYGLTLDEFESVLKQYDLTRINVDTLMSHFACSEYPDSSLNSLQVERFEQAFAAFIKSVPQGRASLCNSSAVCHFAHAHYDIARVGYALYGGNPTPYHPNPMQPVVSVLLPVVQLRQLYVGDTVGYGGDFVAKQDMTVATVYGGYADGILRAGQGNVCLLWGEHALPVLGRVSMDSLVVDLSGLALSERPRKGDQLYFLGNENTLESVASACGTIGYELLTSLSERFARRYID